MNDSISHFLELLRVSGEPSKHIYTYWSSKVFVRTITLFKHLKTLDPILTTRLNIKEL